MLKEPEKYDVDVIAFEDLKGIRENISNDKDFQQRIFSQFYHIVEYKSKEKRVDTVQVDPRKTSKKYSKCKTVSGGNRCGDKFMGIDCGYRLHSDYNTAKNIGLRSLDDLQGGQKSHLGGATCQLALKSETMNTNGGNPPTGMFVSS